jgi:GxxExxY protein
MLARVRNHYLESLDVMDVVSRACAEIMHEHGPGHTECVYEKLLSQYLYEKCVPFLTQVDCFIQKSDTQVHVGRIDMEIAHNTIIELKVGVKVRPQDIEQLRKYVHAKRACGMNIRNAAVVCFTTSKKVEIVQLQNRI